MRKIISVLLAMLMLTGLVACGGSSVSPAGDNTENETKAPVIRERVLEVGYSKVDITPTEPVVLRGGMSVSTYDHIYAITMAFRDEEGSVYIHTITDLIWGGMSDNGPAGSLGVCDMVRVNAEKELGLSPELITVGGTHNHSQVEYGSNDPANVRWRDNILIPQIMVSIREALDDLAPAKMYIGRSETENLTFVRRYWLNDGTFYDGYTGNRDTEIKCHESDADEEIQMVRFVREGKDEIMMVNWQTHTAMVSSSGTSVTSDFVGPLRDRVEQELGVKCVFYQGACGNLSPFSRIPEENTINTSGWPGAEKLGKAVAAYVVDAYESEVFTKVTTGLVQKKRIVVTGDVYKGDVGLLEGAKKVVEYHKSSPNNIKTAEYAKQFGIETIYHAEAIIQNSVLPDKKTYELNIISIGDVAFTTLPMEFFDTTGMQIKDGSPFEMTVLLGYSCGKGKYVADIEAAQNGGYESYNTYFAHGTAEIAVGHYLDALNELYQTRFEN